jgi:transposase
MRHILPKPALFADVSLIRGPKGIAGLGIREWVCDCGVVHDRDVNAARNILNLGLELKPLAGESLPFQG